MTTTFLDEKRAISSVVLLNTTPDERFQRWKEAKSKITLSDWTRLGNLLSIYLEASKADSEALLSSDSKEFLPRFVESRRFDTLENDTHRDNAIFHLLNRAWFLNSPFDGKKTSKLAWMALICGTTQYTLAISNSGSMSLRQLVEGRTGRTSFPSKSFKVDDIEFDGFSEQDRAAAQSYLAFIDSPVDLTSTSLAPWSELVTALRKAWGDCPAIDRIAFLASGIRSKDDSGEDGDLSASDEIVSTFRYARLHSGAFQWWRERLTSTASKSLRRRWMLLLWMWATPRTLLKLAQLLDSLLGELDKDEWTSLGREIFVLSQIKGDDSSSLTRSTSDLSLLKSISSRACSFIGQRMPSVVQYELAVSACRSATLDAPEAQFAFEALARSCSQTNGWSDSLTYIRELYVRGGVLTRRLGSNVEMTREVAERISREPQIYPLFLVAAADATLRSGINERAEPLHLTASRDRWFK
ncbi:hypothetical protein [Bradyrhizobium sp. HKCCYLS20291]|uniref:hypothetical protein n=1 Tax=Bradyrhizobium sp. HKCCYLS20291 TaxID=3420766 RepID=UPI003EBA1F32